MFIRNVSSIQFRYSLLAMAVSTFSPIAWGEGQGSKEVGEVVDKAGVEEIIVNGNPLRYVVVDGVTHTVDGSKPAESYLVRNQGTLIVQSGAVVNHITLDRSSASVSGVVREGIEVYMGELNVRGARIASDTNEGLALNAYRRDPASHAIGHVIDSEIRGVGYGILVSPMGKLTLEGSNVEGVANEVRTKAGGISLAGGIVQIRKGSRVAGDTSAVRIFDGTTSDFEEKNRLEVSGSTLIAREGATIEVIKNPDNTNEVTNADITIADHSILEAGNNHLVEVSGQSTAKVQINNSNLTGDLVADDGSTLNVALGNHARLDGNIVNGNELTIDSSGRWQLAADNTLNSLSIDGGSVGFSTDSYHTLTLGRLSGRGVFDMRIDLSAGVGDFLNVAGAASGDHLLNIRNTGVEAVPEEFEALRVVHTESGDARFGLVGERVDLGAYSYALEQQGTDWFIVGSGKTISPSTQSALALFNVGPTIWNGELSTLRSRMGEVRGREVGGGWLRSYGSRFNASLGSGVSYQQKQRGLSFGADAPLPVSDGHLLVGLMGGYSTSDLNMGQGTSGEVDSYYLGAYGTWLSDDGYYLDGVMKVNQFHNQSKVAMSDGSKAKGDYSNKAVGGSLEFGKHIKLPDAYFVEPFAQISSVWIEGNRYTLDNGLKAKTDQTQSVLGKVGATLGRQYSLDDGGVVQPYVRVAAAHEFSRGNGVRVNDQGFDSDTFGSRAELGAGLSVSLSERLQVHADFDYMKGQHVEQPWGANLGLRLAF
ncbi:autotransporter outer membrane beta-barrel domain-containing protein [Pseudomonas sp. GD03842]|uniref:autotransporter outer membrane beta-barrel domain-containing protein n=1 Tax=Pseudomonas sp. GD03842 TaxID=2975385 RepID=UPI0024487889|nr:autotransporter outer membrane beta-barrel domain-containing protein [Pseudomonas sp. GD03842]MDH0745399.1 autotransporter outer membrane beta-barrel domain-containing protein [Pseudomonas sp. GD03842]